MSSYLKVNDPQYVGLCPPSPNTIAVKASSVYACERANAPQVCAIGLAFAVGSKEALGLCTRVAECGLLRGMQT